MEFMHLDYLCSFSGRILVKTLVLLLFSRKNYSHFFNFKIDSLKWKSYDHYYWIMIFWFMHITLEIRSRLILFHYWSTLLLPLLIYINRVRFKTFTHHYAILVLSLISSNRFAYLYLISLWFKSKNNYYTLISLWY